MIGTLLAMIHATPTAAAILATMRVATAEALVHAIKNPADRHSATPARPDRVTTRAIKAHHARVAVETRAAVAAAAAAEAAAATTNRSRAVAVAVHIATNGALIQSPSGPVPTDPLVSFHRVKRKSVGVKRREQTLRSHQQRGDRPRD